MTNVVSDHTWTLAIVFIYATIPIKLSTVTNKAPSSKNLVACSISTFIGLELLHVAMIFGACTTAMKGAGRGWG